MPRTVEETANGGEDSVEFSLKFKDDRLELKMKEPGPSQRHRLVVYDSGRGKDQVIRTALLRFVAEMVFVERAIYPRSDLQTNHHKESAKMER
ncbi:integral membrane sensor signal transduction histidine kinase [Tepidicaulis marinus]|uniref:Integral membrane sensor signal transduction histidine kinase n=1 Tax=Tepidicaulis marinus TaxID=1333998 RepID=A0A081BF18_9HYPH|nr:hypothetical protein [Tepidicaulis marinus]GAK46636.1 integral membrane sensor signal transduction histidine kinase [Tepidicaulis marinus]